MGCYILHMGVSVPAVLPGWTWAATARAIQLLHGILWSRRVGENRRRRGEENYPRQEENSGKQTAENPLETLPDSSINIVRCANRGANADLTAEDEWWQSLTAAERKRIHASDQVKRRRAGVKA